MSGPKYPGVTESHKYGPIPPKPPQAGEMTGPVHLADGKNQFSKVDERVAGQVSSLSLLYFWAEFDTKFQAQFVDLYLLLPIRSLFTEHFSKSQNFSIA